MIFKKFCSNARLCRRTFIRTNKMVAGGDIPAIESLEVETVPELQEIYRWDVRIQRTDNSNLAEVGFWLSRWLPNRCVTTPLIVWGADMAPLDTMLQWQINWILHRVSPSRINPTRLRESQTEASQPENGLNRHCQEVSGCDTSRRWLNIIRIIQESVFRNWILVLNYLFVIGV